MGMLAIIVSLLLLMLLAYRGISVLLLAPLMAALAVLLSGDGAFLLPIYTDTFMGAWVTMLCSSSRSSCLVRSSVS